MVEFIVVDQKQYNNIAKNYNLSPKSQQINALPSCLVFLPDSQNNAGIESGDKINIGRLKLSNNALEFENFDLWVEDVSRQIYQDQELLGSSKKEIISIIIPENVVKQHGLFNGFSNIQAYLNGDVTPKINQAMHNISSHVTGGFIQSKQEFNQQSQTLSLYIAQIASTMFLVIAVYVVICITSMIYVIILERQDEYALKLSLGMSRFNLLKSFFTELIICNSLAFVISVTCILWYMYGAVFSMSLWNYIGLYLIIYFIMSILLSLTLYVPLRYLKKNSIASMFNIPE